MRVTPCRPTSRRAFHRSGTRRRGCRSRRLFLEDGALAWRRSCTNRSTGSTACLLARRWRRRRRRRRQETSGSRGAAQETPIGYVPAKNGLTLDGLKISDEALNELLQVNPGDWELELEDSKQFLAKFGERLPGEIREEHEKLTRRFQRVVTA